MGKVGKIRKKPLKKVFGNIRWKNSLEKNSPNKNGHKKTADSNSHEW